MFSKGLILFLVFLFCFGIAKARIIRLTPEDTTKYKRLPDWAKIKKAGEPTYRLMTPEETERYKKQHPAVFDGSGVPYEGVRGQKNTPQIVTDTVRCSNGFGVLDLNAQRGRGRLSVVPSSSNDIHVFGIIPIITDSTQSVPTYGAWINRELNQLNIQSSDASDTRLVQVSFMVQ